MVLEDADFGWDQECIQLLAKNQIEIFMGLEVSSVSIAEIKAKIDAAILGFGAQSLSGFTFSEPNTVNGFADESFIPIFDFVRSKGLKIMLEGYNNVYDIETINRVDSIVIFKDNFEKFSENCVEGRNSGPFCQQSQISNQIISELTSAVQNNLIDASKFITMIFDVDQAEVDNVIVSHYSSVFNGGIFISDQTVDQVTYRPSYFNYLSREITSTSNEIDAASNCGCNEIDECALGTHDCPAYANCHNFAGGYSCACKPGFQEIINNGELTCLDINECLSSLNTCHSDATCANTVGSYECDCDVGFSGDGHECLDIDECATWELSQCQENSECVNYAGGYACVCQVG